MTENEVLVRQLYAGFNLRNVAAVLSHLAKDVVWANGMEGGHIHGREAVGAYWTKQWAAIQPQVEPIHITDSDDGSTAVEVHQIVRDLEGRLLLDESVRHVFWIEGALVARFDIENAGQLASLGKRNVDAESPLSGSRKPPRMDLLGSVVDFAPNSLWP